MIEQSIHSGESVASLKGMNSGLGKGGKGLKNGLFAKFLAAFQTQMKQAGKSEIAGAGQINLTGKRVNGAAEVAVVTHGKHAVNQHEESVARLSSRLIASGKGDASGLNRIAPIDAKPTLDHDKLRSALFATLKGENIDSGSDAGEKVQAGIGQLLAEAGVDSAQAKESFESNLSAARKQGGKETADTGLKHASKEALNASGAQLKDSGAQPLQHSGERMGTQAAAEQMAAAAAKQSLAGPGDEPEQPAQSHSQLNPDTPLKQADAGKTAAAAAQNHAERDSGRATAAKINAPAAAGASPKPEMLPGGEYSAADGKQSAANTPQNIVHSDQGSDGAWKNRSLPAQAAGEAIIPEAEQVARRQVVPPAASGKRFDAATEAADAAESPAHHRPEGRVRSPLHQPNLHAYQQMGGGKASIHVMPEKHSDAQVSNSDPVAGKQGAPELAIMDRAQQRGAEFAAQLSQKAMPMFKPAEAMLEIARSAKEGSMKLELHLEPAHLGKVHVTLQHDAGKQLQVHFTVDQAVSRQVIEQHLPQLRAALAQQGIDTGQFSMNMNSHGQSGAGAGNGEGGAGTTPFDRFATASAPLDLGQENGTRLGINRADGGHISILA